MSDRNHQRRAFLDNAGWSDAQISPLAGDASNRRYLRLCGGPGPSQAVLMDAPSDRGEDVRPFIRVAEHLLGLGLGPPRILASDPAQGFLLLEDLGNALFTRVLEQSPNLEQSLYEAATDVLVALHKAPLPDWIAPYDPKIMAELSALAFDWYAKGVAGHVEEAARAEFKDAFARSLHDIEGTTEVLIQRDYHAENLIWLPDRKHLLRVGLLDFQDAMAGHRAYDLVSLLQDARRDVSPEVESTMIKRYVGATDVSQEVFRYAYCLLGVQRNLRILGVFARLCIRDGKAQYVDFIPRVWAHLQRDLKIVSLSGIEDVLRANLPPPTPEALLNLKDKCATNQMQ